MKIRFKYSAVATTIALACGLIGFTQGLSFARLNDSLKLERHIDSHATLIAILGFGLFFLAASVQRVFLRLTALEKEVGLDSSASEKLYPDIDGGIRMSTITKIILGFVVGVAFAILVMNIFE